ncbi:MAG: hypothetical protein LBE56_00930 [Tannerella sp.]|jgi:hypothetical protein|nr:hypothetical protein [Tannerella sp.]
MDTKKLRQKILDIAIRDNKTLRGGILDNKEYHKYKQQVEISEFCC